jgi:hypothetical protein
LNGEVVYASLLKHRHLWLAALLDRPGVPNYTEPGFFLTAGLIKLRDLPDNFWNADTLFILTRTRVIGVKADLPGIDAKDVEVSVMEGTLVLRGEKKEEKKEERKDYQRVERFAGQFYREIPLPPGTDPDKIAASSSQGVVTITIPKKPEVQPRKITVAQQD